MFYLKLFTFRMTLSLFGSACLIFHAGDATAGRFNLQCRPDESIGRIVVRTGHNDRLQFIGIECRVGANGPRRILKSGIERGKRHEIKTPKQITELRYTQGTCANDGFTQFPRICSVSFRFADQTGTSDFGAKLLTGSQRVLNGNGEIYGIAGVFRKEASDVESGYSDLKIVTRKFHAESDPNYNILGVIGDIRGAMLGTMGYAIVIRNPQGKRVGFAREGWAIHPLDENFSQHARQFDVHTRGAVGSTTKAWATAAAALRVDEFTQADTLGTNFQQYLPRRWRSEMHDRFDGATVLHVIKHRAGFRNSGPSTSQTGGVFPARFRLANGEFWPGVDNVNNPLPAGTNAPFARLYSNSAGGMFHFILAHMMLASASGAPAKENEIQGLSDAAYDAEISKFTAEFYCSFVQEHILAPVAAAANCNSRAFLGNAPVAASYSGLNDRTGVFPADASGHCAAGGWVISANDLSAVLSALRNTNKILNSDSRAKMFSTNKATRVWDIMVGGHHTHDGLYDGMRAVVIVTKDRYSAALIYNSPLTSNLEDQQMVADAFNNNVR